MVSFTRGLLFILQFTFPAAVFPALVQQAANVVSHCGEPLQRHTRQAPNALLAANRTVVSLIVEDDFAGYRMRVSVGSPSTNYTLPIDTGSANIFVGVNQKYVSTSLSMNTTQPVNRSFIDNTHLIGFEFFDTVGLGLGCVVLNQSIGVANASSNFAADGILGIGPTQLTQGTLSNEKGQSIPTITDNLAAMNFTPSKIVGLSFRPWNESNTLTGQITWGDIDQSNLVGPLIYVPITKTQPAGGFMGINASIFYDNQPLLSNGAGVIDSGSTKLLLAADVFDAYTKAADVKNGSDYSSISPNNYEKLKPLVFVIGNSSFALTPDGQRLPPSAVRNFFRPSPFMHYLPIDSNKKPSGNGNDFSLGLPFLRRFYVVYDSDNQRVGVANTSYTDPNVD